MRTKNINKHKKNKLTRKKYKRLSKKYIKINNNKKQKKTKKHIGGDNFPITEAEHYKTINEFRSHFREFLLQLINWRKNEKRIPKIMNDLGNFFAENRQIINTLIPVNTQMKPVLTNINDYVSIPTVILSNINNVEINKQLLALFFNNGGIMNTYSTKVRNQNNVFNYVVENNQNENVKLLLDYGLTRDNLKEENKLNFDRIMGELEPVAEVAQVVAPLAQVVAPLAQVVERQVPVKQVAEQIEEKQIAEQIEEKQIAKIEEKPVAQIEEKPSEKQEEKQIEKIEEKPAEKPEVQIEKISEQIEPVEQFKLSIPEELPKEKYKKDEAPAFWVQLFSNNDIDLMKLKEKIHVLLEKDEITNVTKKKLAKAKNPWTTCEIVESMFPAYYTKNNPDYGANTTDFININTALCIMLLLLGIISNNMRNQDYNFIFKGGKSVQFVLSEIQQSSKYLSDDIDISLTSVEGIVYDKMKMEIVATHISFLIHWFLSDKINISIELPNTSIKTAGKDIIKISYLSALGRYTPLGDVGFGKINENVEQYFKNPQVFEMYDPELETKLMFRSPNIEHILYEKLYYYLKFIELRNILKTGGKITETGYQDMTLDKLDYFMKKFKRSIKAIIDGLIIRHFGKVDIGEITKFERNVLEDELAKINATTPFKEELIKGILNTNPYEV